MDDQSRADAVRCLSPDQIQAELRDEYLASHSYPWIVGFSGGKDSTLLAQLVFELLMDLAPGDRKRPVHILCNDTLVESPVFMAYIDRKLARLRTRQRIFTFPSRSSKLDPTPIRHSGST